MDLYMPLSVEFVSDDKIIAASIHAEHVFVRSLAFCKRTLNDGQFTVAQIRRECEKLDRWHVDEACAELVELGLFDNNDDRLSIPSWLKRNPSRAALEAAKDAKKRGGIEGNHKRWHVGKHGTPSAGCELCFSSVLASATRTESVTESLAIPKRREEKGREGKGRELPTEASCKTKEETAIAVADEVGQDNDTAAVIDGRITNPRDTGRLTAAINHATKHHRRTKVLEIAHHAIGKALTEAHADPIGYAARMVTDYATEPAFTVPDAETTSRRIDELRAAPITKPPDNAMQAARQALRRTPDT